MFTGLIQGLGIVIASTEVPEGRKLTVSLAQRLAAPIRPGDSICVGGVCLTATGVQNGTVSFNVVGETLRRSTLGRKQPGDRLNLELSLRADSFVGGHFVQGHVDAIAKVISIGHNPDDWRITFDLPPESLKFMVPKGSVSLDGVSMTIADVSPHSFAVAVIPTTLAATTLSALAVGDPVNVETDILSRTVVHYLEQTLGRGPGHPKTPRQLEGPITAPAITLARLLENGFA